MQALYYRGNMLLDACLQIWFVCKKGESWNEIRRFAFLTINYTHPSYSHTKIFLINIDTHHMHVVLVLFIAQLIYNG